MWLQVLVLVTLVQLDPALPTPQRSCEEVRNAKSEEMRKYMNESVDPCENFYDFACGNWKTHYPALPKAGEYQTRSYLMAVSDFDRKLAQLLATVNEADTATERKVKNFYASCMTTSLQTSDYKEKLTQILNEFGEMPALKGRNKWQEDSFDWLKTVAEISYKYGRRIILGYRIIPDWQDNTAHSLLLTAQEFKNKNNFEDYRKIITEGVEADLTEYLSLRPRAARKAAKEIVDFEAILSAGSLQEDSDKMNLTTMEELQNKYAPALDIEQLMNISMGFIPSEVVVDHTPSYEQTLIEALQQTPKRVVANYIFYHLLRQFVAELPRKTKNLEEFCIRQAQEYFGIIATNMIFHANNLTESKQEIEQMWQAIKMTAENILESSRLSWFDDASREFALEKLHSMKMEIPSYEHYNFDELYGQLTLSKDDYMENLKNIMAFNAKKTRASLELAPLYKDLGLVMYTPSFIKSANTIIFPASTLTSEYFWSPYHPIALVFGRLGFFVAHELFHGFTAAGRFYNNLGNFQATPPWDDEIESEYAERRACLHDQYHNYTYGGKHLPQDALQSENAADNGGILVAYEAYRHWYEGAERTKEELERETLPLLNYTSNQLFFINYAQTWCADTLETVRSTLAKMDTHSPDEIRGYAPLTNSRKFSKAFNCAKGSPMNPVRRCEFL